MGRRNYLIEGLSGTGKTTVCDELQRRGHHAVHGDRELAYQGDPATGAPLPGFVHEHHIWSVEKVVALLDDRAHEATFFCGGLRNHAVFLDRFDAVFVLQVDPETLERRLEARPADEFGGGPEQRAFVLQLHRAGDDVPSGIPVDATRPVAEVVDRILAVVDEGDHARAT